jgi:periplasmic divalent cation tolerance protein
MLIAWTTVASRAEADQLAAEVVRRGLAACVQVDGPVTSHYLWQGKPERTEEFRLACKFLPRDLAALEAFVLAHHSYETPEWLVVPASRVSEKYLSWAEATPRNSSL